MTAMMTAAEIAKEAQALPLESRGELVEALIQGFEGSTSSAHSRQWIDEVQRRRQEAISGKIDLIDGDEVAKHVRDLLRK